jgi:hypothetical protein
MGQKLRDLMADFDLLPLANLFLIKEERSGTP